MNPRPHSPTSKAVRLKCSGLGSRYGTTISENDIRCATGLALPPSS